MHDSAELKHLGISTEMMTTIREFERYHEIRLPIAVDARTPGAWRIDFVPDAALTFAGNECSGGIIENCMLNDQHRERPFSVLSQWLEYRVDMTPTIRDGFLEVNVTATCGDLIKSVVAHRQHVGALTFFYNSDDDNDYDFYLWKSPGLRSLCETIYTSGWAALLAHEEHQDGFGLESTWCIWRGVEPEVLKPGKELFEHDLKQANDEFLRILAWADCPDKQERFELAMNVMRRHAQRPRPRTFMPLLITEVDELLF